MVSSDVLMRRGEIWAAGESAWIGVGDLEAGDHHRLLAFSRKRGWAPGALYSDPPWSKRNAAFFRNKITDVKTHVDFLGSLLPRVLECAVECKGSCLIEMGLQHISDLEQLVTRISTVKPLRANMTYKDNGGFRPIVGLGFSTGAARAPEMDLFEGMDDADTPRQFCSKLPPEVVVMDPCTGLGCTPVSAIRMGRRFLGMELNPLRAAVALRKAAWHAGRVEPKLVGNFLESSGD